MLASARERHHRKVADEVTRRMILLCTRAGLSRDDSWALRNHAFALELDTGTRYLVPYLGMRCRAVFRGGDAFPPRYLTPNSAAFDQQITQGPGAVAFADEAGAEQGAFVDGHQREHGVLR